MFIEKSDDAYEISRYSVSKPLEWQFYALLMSAFFNTIHE